MFKDLPEKERWIDKLTDLIELESEKCPQKKGECYMNEILNYVLQLIEKAKEEGRKEHLTLLDKSMVKEMKESKEWTELQSKIIKQVREEAIRAVLPEGGDEQSNGWYNCRERVKELAKEKFGIIIN